ncbi:MAG: hypothetical protein SFU27_06415 [Thermonemataceae bacterium]|nr:hypothetical protein [Thermonemataceae bacterium]
MRKKGKVFPRSRANILKKYLTPNDTLLIANVTGVTRTHVTNVIQGRRACDTIIGDIIIRNAIARAKQNRDYEKKAIVYARPI